MMNKRYPWIVLISLVFLISGACTEKSTPIISTVTLELTATTTPQSPTKSIEPSLLPITPTQTVLNPSPISSVTGETPYPGIASGANTPLPMNTPVAGSSQAPYPPPSGSIPIPDSVYNPYPGPGSPPQGNTGQSAGATPYPGPGGNSPANPTQAVAINPIQSPIPTLAGTAVVTAQTSSTAIVSSGLKASDPGSVRFGTGKFQFIEFFAFWDPSSKSMAPVINGLEAKYQGRITFAYLDIDNPANDPLKHYLGYRYQPQFFLLDGTGTIVRQWIGFTPVEDFEAVLSPLFP